MTLDTRRFTLFTRRNALAFFGGVLLAVPYLDHGLFVLSWFAFVPLLFALRETSGKQAYGLGLLFGLGFYPVCWYWFVEFAQLLKNYPLPLALIVSTVFWLFCAQLPAMLALSYRFLQRRLPISDLILFPLCVTTAYSLWPMLFPVQLGESQSRFLWAIQGADLVGVYGVDFILALFNVLLFRLLCQFRQALNSRANAVAGLLVLLWFGYGMVALQYWQTELASWSTRAIGIVQPNQPPSEDVPPPEPGYTKAYPLEMELTEKLVAAGAEWVVWPETRYKGYYDDEVIFAAYQRNVAKLGVPVIFHDLRSRYTEPDADRKEYNTLVALDRTGSEVLSYQKTKLVMFAETLPFLNDHPTMQRLLGHYGGGFFKQLSPGSGPTNIRLQDFWLAPVICYEVMFPEFTAEAIARHAQGVVLVSISNTAWFGDTVVSNVEFNMSVLRSVENRVPLIHVINNGASGIVLPSGEVAMKTEYRVQAGYLANMPYHPERGGSFFTRHPYLFINSIHGLFFAFLLFAFGASRSIRLRE